MGLLSFFASKTGGLAPPPPPRRKRSYAAAAMSRLFSDFVTSHLNADSEIRPALRVLRNRCRDLARNNDYARRYVNILKTNVVGPHGIKIQVRGRDDNGNLDLQGNRLIEQAWDQWTQAGVCTIDQRLSWVDAQALFVESLACDGEPLIQLIRNAPNAFGFALYFLESDHLDEEYNQKLQNGHLIKMGVELDPFRRPVAYHLYKEHPGENVLARGAGSQRMRVPAEGLLHCYFQQRPEQTRGVPLMVTALGRLKMLDGYEEAELVAARVAAAKMGFFVSPDGEEYTGDDTEDDYTPITEAAPGSFEQLPAGMDFKAFDPDHPTTAFPDFEKAILRGIASGLNISYVSLSNNLEGVSYSSIRQGVMEDRDHFQMLQQFMINHFVRPVFRAWLLMAMTTGAVPLPIAKYAKFADSALFVPRGFGWVDPQREIQSQVLGLENGIMTLQDIAAHQGRDVEEVFEQIERERELAKQYGIQLAFEPFGSKTPPPSPNPEDEHENG